MDMIVLDMLASFKPMISQKPGVLLTQSAKGRTSTYHHQQVDIGSNNVKSLDSQPLDGLGSLRNDEEDVLY